MKAKTLYKKLMADYGGLLADEAFWSALELGQVEIFHDVMGCQDCFVGGQIVYCPKSCYNPVHRYHLCPPGEACTCS